MALEQGLELKLGWSYSIPTRAAGAGALAATEGTVAGFQYALFLGVLLSVLAFFIALRIKDPPPMQWGKPETDQAP